MGGSTRWPKQTFFVNDYGADPLGVADSTAAIASARTDARRAGGGIIAYGPGTYLSGNQDISTDVFVFHRGAGYGATVIKLKNNANTDLFSAQTSSINLSAVSGTGAAGTLYNFGFADLTLDGNKANNSSGWCVRVYGYGYTLENVRIKNGKSGGMLTDWNGGSNSPGQDSMEASFVNVKFHDNAGIGLQVGGPHDSKLVNCISYSNDSHSFHLAPNCGGMQFSNCHAWGPKTGVTGGAIGFLVEAGSCYFDGCEAEGADTSNVVLLSTGNTWVGGSIFGGGVYSCTGLQLGQQAGNTPYAGMINQSAGVTTAVSSSHNFVRTLFIRCEGTNGAVWFANDAGANDIQAFSYQTAGKVVNGGSTKDDALAIRVSGLSPDGSTGLGGLYRFPVNAFSGWTVTDTSQDIFNVNTAATRFEMVNGTNFRMYSDNYSTQQFQITGSSGNIATNGNLQLGNSSTIYSGSGVPSNGTGSNGDFYFRTDTPGTANQRLYVKAAGAWSGIL